MSEYKDFLFRQRESQQKWDYFLISISLAFLVITFQAFNKDGSKGFELLALISWLSMIISALLGLYRLRKMYVFMMGETDNIRATERNQLTEEFISGYNKFKEKTQKKIMRSNIYQLILFGLSIFVYIIFIACTIYPAFFGFLNLSK